MWAAAVLLCLPLVVDALPYLDQVPLTSDLSSTVTWQEVVATPYLDTWALNPAGDAAVIRVSTVDVETETPTGDEWVLSVQSLNYTIAPPAYPPSASEPSVVAHFKLPSSPEKVVYSEGSGKLVLVLDGTVEASFQHTGSLVVVDINEAEGIWDTGEQHFPLAGTDLLYTLDLDHLGITQISGGNQGAVFSPTWSFDGKLAWLEQREDGNARDQRRLWLHDGDGKWEVKLKDWHLSPLSVLFSKNGEAINLLTLHSMEQSLYHIWTPNRSTSPVTPILIPSHGTIHEAIHVGISPLNHSHLIGVKSSLTSARELFVISHSPFEDPTDNLEEIRLTEFSEQTLHGKSMTKGIEFYFDNDVGQRIQGRIMVPKTGAAKKPVLFYLHGDEEGAGWHDWWMPYMNQNGEVTASHLAYIQAENPEAFVTAGFIVVNINPTGAEGYGDSESFHHGSPLKKGFIRARTGQWGNQTITDLAIGLKYCIKNFPVDENNLFAYGYGAYGGFAVHWLQGHNEDFGFKGFISHDGILSPRWWALESAVPSTANWEFGSLIGSPDSPFNKWDPERFVAKWNSPELLITDGDGELWLRGKS
ncbi:hypothetical protein P7C73_g4174, partial [Tremellales sp. Uapishka_1]